MHGLLVVAILFVTPVVIVLLAPVVALAVKGIRLGFNRLGPRTRRVISFAIAMIAFAPCWYFLFFCFFFIWFLVCCLADHVAILQSDIVGLAVTYGLILYAPPCLASWILAYCVKPPGGGLFMLPVYAVVAADYVRHGRPLIRGLRIPSIYVRALVWALGALLAYLCALHGARHRRRRMSRQREATESVSADGPGSDEHLG